MALCVIAFSLAAVLLPFQAQGAWPVLNNCPDYVPEGGDPTCLCTRGDCASGRPTIYWQHQDPDSRSPRLQLTNVQRADNGTQFTCYMTCGGSTNTISYTLIVAYGRVSENNTFISGNLTFNTDGARMLNLTCIATDVNPSPRYFWVDTPCINSNTSSTCSLIPRLPADDGMSVTCLAASTVTGGDVRKTATIYLQYPPPQRPEIRGCIEDDDVLATRDNLTCTVSGGKPLVQRVIFSCTTPEMADQEDARNASSVWSSVTVDTSRGPLTGTLGCTCTAVWGPEPSLYTLRGARQYHSATIDSLTVSGQSASAELQEGSSTDINIECRARGRPYPVMVLVKRSGDDLAVLLGQQQNDGDAIVLTFTKSGAACDDTGIYTCFADNGFRLQDKKPLQISVMCKPRPGIEGFPNTRLNPPDLTRRGLTLTLMAFPVPQDFLYFRYKSTDDDSGKKVSSASVIFETDCRQNDVSSALVTCHVIPIAIPENFVGLYRIEISNGRGSTDYYFGVKHPVIPMTRSKSDNSAGAIAGGAIAAVVTVIFVVTGAILWRRTYKRYEIQRSGRDENMSHECRAPQRPQAAQEEPPSCSGQKGVHCTPATYYANAKQRQDLVRAGDPVHYVNVETSFNTYEDVDDGSADDSSTSATS